MRYALPGQTRATACIPLADSTLPTPQRRGLAHDCRKLKVGHSPSLTKADLALEVALVEEQRGQQDGGISIGCRHAVQIWFSLGRWRGAEGSGAERGGAICYRAASFFSHAWAAAGPAILSLPPSHPQH